KPDSSEPSVKIPTPMTNMRRRPVASPARPAGTSSMPKASAYPEITHCSDPVSASRPSPIAVSPTLMTLTAISAMNSGARRTARRGLRRTGGVSALGSGITGSPYALSAGLRRGWWPVGHPGPSGAQGAGGAEGGGPDDPGPGCAGPDCAGPDCEGPDGGGPDGGGPDGPCGCAPPGGGPKGFCPAGTSGPRASSRYGPGGIAYPVRPDSSGAAVWITRTEGRSE